MSMCVPEVTTLANVVQLLGTGMAGFFVVDSLRMLMQRRPRSLHEWDDNEPDPACMRLGERMERQADYVRRVERQS